MTPSLVGCRVARLGAIMLGFLALPLLAGAARRDALTLASDAIESRPHQAHERMLARWLGNFGFLMVLYAALALFAFGAQAVSGPVLEGAGPRVSLRAFGDAVIAGALPLLFLSALGYCAAELLQNVLAAAVIALYWLLVLLGGDYLSRVFDFSLSQNAAVYVLLSAGVVLAAMAAVRYRQGLGNARRLNLPILSALCLLAGLGLARHLLLARHDPPMHAHPLALTVAGQSIRSGRLPGFWLPDQHGHRVRLYDFRGKVLVVAFWSPVVRSSIEVLSTLQRIDAEYSARGVQVIGVCLSDDMSTGRRFALERGYTFPMVTDTGTHWAEKIEDSSPLAEAYEVLDLPMTYLADGKRNLVDRVGSSSGGSWGGIRAKVEELLARGEPQT